MKRLIMDVCALLSVLIVFPADADTIKQVFVDPESYSVSFTEYSDTETGSYSESTIIKTHNDEFLGLFEGGEAICYSPLFEGAVEGTYETTGNGNSMYVYCPYFDDMYIYQFGGN